MKKLMALIVIVLLGVANYSYAGTEKGMKELQVQGSFSTVTNSVDEDQRDTLSSQLTFNYFLSSYFSLGGSARLSNSVTEYDKSKNMDDSKSETTFLFLRGDLYLGGGRHSFVPYIGAHGGQIDSDTKTGNNVFSYSTEAYGAHGGFKVFPNESTSWNIELDQTSYKPEFQGIVSTYKTTNRSLLVGFSYYF